MVLYTMEYYPIIEWMKFCLNNNIDGNGTNYVKWNKPKHREPEVSEAFVGSKIADIVDGKAGY